MSLNLISDSQKQNLMHQQRSEPAQEETFFRKKSLQHLKEELLKIKQKLKLQKLKKKNSLS
jgi:hypothetical protein